MKESDTTQATIGATKIKGFVFISALIVIMKQPVQNRQLKAHIWSKHTPEHKRPFQCPCHDCSRGFASKANLMKHIEKHHNIKMPKHNKNILAFKILTFNKNTKRTRIYNDYQIITPENMPENISMEDFYYDIYSKTISIKSYTRNSLKKIYRKMQNIDSP